MITVMYRWKIRPDDRDEFQQLWKKVTKIDENPEQGLLQSELFNCGKKDIVVINKFTDKKAAADWAQRADWRRFMFRWEHERQAGPENLALIAWLGAEVPEAPGCLTITKIQEVVAAYFGISKSKITSATRRADIVFARHIAMWFCKKFTPRSFPEIGAKFGGRDHTSVMHGHTRIRDLLRKKFILPNERAKNKFANENFDGRSLSDMVDEIKEDLGLPATQIN